MKKLSKIVLCIVLVLCMVQNVLFAKDVSNANTYKYFDMAVFALKNIGALSADTDMNSLSEKEISRAQFADILAKVLKLDDSGNTYFSDVSSDYWAAGSISSLVENGIISFSALNSFEPDRTITYEEACKMLLCAAGYRSYAEAMGGFPYGYTAVAASFKFNSNILSYDKLCYSDAITLLWKGLNIELYELTAISANGDAEFGTKNETLLGKCRNMYYNTGRLESCYGGRIKNYFADENEIVIDGTLYDVPESFDGLSLLGRKVNYLYTVSDDESNSTVLYIDNAGTKENVTEMLIEDLKDFSEDSYTLSYFENNQTNTADISISKSATVVYNGEVYKDKLSELFDEILTHDERGKITVIDSENESDLVIIEKVHPVHVSAFTTDEVIFNTYNTAERIDIGNADSVVMYDQDGEKSSFEIKLNDIYQVSVSKNGKRIKIRKLLASLNGTVESTDGNSVVVDGNDMDVDKYCLNYRRMPELNVSYSFVTDEYGWIVSYEKTSEEYGFKYGYLVDYSKDSGLSSELKIKLYTQDKTMEVYAVRSKCKVNAAVVKSDDIVNNPALIADADGKVKQQLIRYRINKENEIIEIDTTKLGVNEDADNSLRKETAKHSGDEYMRSMRPNGVLTLDREHIINESQTIVFEVPTMDKEEYLQAARYFAGNSNYTTYSVEYVVDASGNKIKADDSMYAIGALGDSDARRMVDVYYCGDDDAFAPCVVWHKDIAFMIQAPFVYGGTQKTIGEDGNSYTNAILTTSWGKVSYRLNDSGMVNITAKAENGGRGETVPLEIGDVVQIAVDRNNTIYNMQILYSRKYDSFNNNWSGCFGSPHGNWLNGYDQIFGDVSTNILRCNIVKRSGTVLYLDSDDDGKADIKTDAANIKILVFDKDSSKNGYCVTGSISDIMDAKTSGAKVGDTVLNVMNGNSPIYIYVYK